MYVPQSLLKRHVQHSNAIERIYDTRGPWLTGHLAAAELVATHPLTRRMLKPPDIHKVLVEHTPLGPFGGKMRDCRMWVGDRECPKPEHVPMLMEWWGDLARAFLAIPRSDVPFVATLLHDLFLCIHPYRDGNGRTARLILNALRLRRGFPWQVVDAYRIDNYYERIRSVEKHIFREEFPSVY